MRGGEREGEREGERLTDHSLLERSGSCVSKMQYGHSISWVW